MQPPSVLRLIKAGSNRWSMADIFLRDDRRAKSNRMEQSLSREIGVSFLHPQWLPARGRYRSLGLYPLFQPLRSQRCSTLLFFFQDEEYFPYFDVNLGIFSGFSLSIVSFLCVWVWKSIMFFVFNINDCKMRRESCIKKNLIKVSHPMRLLNSFPCCQKLHVWRLK